MRTAARLAYLAAVGRYRGAGLWSAVWTWRHRPGKAHMLSLLLVVWGSILGLQEILPRVGYATPTLDIPQSWSRVG